MIFVKWVTVMTNNQYETDIQQLIVLSKKIRQNPQSTLIAHYTRVLNRLMLNGWTYALGNENEIDESHLPNQYINQRNRVIDDLEIQLAYCAGEFYASSKGSSEEQDIIGEYYKIFDELVRISGGIKRGFDFDSELPNELMPKEYEPFLV